MSARPPGSVQSFVVSQSGCDWARDLAARQGTDVQRAKWLRRHLSASQAAALLDLEAGRRSLRARWPGADGLFAGKTAAEQASSSAVSMWRSSRFEHARIVADLGTSCGFDSISLKNPFLVAMDRDPGRLVYAQANLRGREGETVIVAGDVMAAMPRVDLAFADPDRRPGGRRTLDPEEASPSLSALLEACEAAKIAGVGVKLAPGVDERRIDADGEVEFISERHELKEAVLWTGDLANGQRRASLADHGVTIAGERRDPPMTDVIGEWLFDPDPALVRSGLLGHVAENHGLAGFEKRVAYLTGENAIDDPFLRRRRIAAVLGPEPKLVRAWLREQRIGRLDVSRRKFAVDPEQFRRSVQGAGTGDGYAHLHLTHLAGKPIVIVTRN